MEIQHDHGCCQSPQAIFRFRVAWDILKIILCFLLIISIIAASIAFIDKGKIPKDFDTFKELKWEKAYKYSLGGVFVLLGIVGIIHGCIHICSGEESSSSSSDVYNRSRHHHSYHHNGCCSGYNIWYVGSGNNDCGGSDCNCNSGSGNDNNDGVAIFFMVIAVILIIIGVVYAIVVCCILISRWSEEHYAKLNAKLMTREYVVKDLQKYSKGKILKMQEKQQLAQAQNPVPSAPDEEVDDDGPPKKPKSKTITIM